jgi:tetratricopeptide (TPR) repeat protein
VASLPAVGRFHLAKKTNFKHMNYSELIKNQASTYMFLAGKRLKEALDLLDSMVKETHRSDLIDAHYNNEMTYKSLLHFTVEGFSDPGRQKIYNHLLADLYLLADKVYLDLLTQFGQGLYYEASRKHLAKPSTVFADIVDETILQLGLWNLANEGPNGLQPYTDELNGNFVSLFEILMTQPAIWDQDESLKKIFGPEAIPWHQQSVFTSALLLHLLHHFNLKGLHFLFDLTTHPHAQVQQRALVALMLILFKYDQRLALYPEITERLMLLLEKQQTANGMIALIIQLVRTRETEKLAKKLNDEILPVVARIHPNLRNRLDLDHILGDSYQEGKNPDWQNIFSDSPELMDKLEEFSKLQMEGADLFVSTFRMLKQFPFFQKTDNWFLPFYFPNPAISQILQDETGAFKNPELVKGMAESGVLCNSDKYSLILSIPQMPAAQKELMGQMFMAELGALRDLEKSDELIGPDKAALTISNQYIQDLYRFFKVHPNKNNLDDPFSWPLDFHNCWFIDVMFSEPDLLTKLGEYLFEKDRYREALDVFNLLAVKTPPSMQLLQKEGFCYQQLDDYEKALQLYLQADLFTNNQVWNLKKIALCYRHLKNPDKAVEYYLQAEKQKPDDLHTQVSIGHCLLEMKNYAEALKYYFKVEYLDPKNKKVWRPIVWCSLSLGKFEQAGKYCLKNLEETPTQNDYLNMGHIRWCQGNRKEALVWYQKCIKHPGHSLSEFLDAFENDRTLLIEHKVDEADIPIMMDQLRYYLQNS